jgi:signal transduction histidine kinase
MGTADGSSRDLEDIVRYDSMLSTALSLDADDSGGQIAQWRQLVDLVVQAKSDLSASMRAQTLRRIERLRAIVPVEQRRLAACQLASRAGHRDGVALFGSDEPVIAAPVLSVATLDDADWQALIPQIPPASRAILRNRRDLPEGAVRALATYGLTDFALPASDAQAGDPGMQIRDLVARIEAFRLGAAGSPVRDMQLVSDEFTFETTPDGLLDWIAGVPREAIIGLSIAEIAAAGGYGVDGQAAGAYRRRAPFRDARLLVAGSGPANGDWLISGRPVFNPANGRFAGYHGTARRPRPDEIAGPTAQFAGTTIPVDSLRQLIHELRTPLNAILGFAEMIDRQLLGPASHAYREQAQAIVTDGERLLAMVDDLDQAARARSEANAADAVIDGEAMLARIKASLQPTLAARNIFVNVVARPSVEIFGVGPAMLERMIGRLIGAVVALAADGETVDVALAEPSSGLAVLSVARPAVLSGVTVPVLLDPGYDPRVPYPDAPLLGLGFTLRLLKSLTRDVGGRFSIGADAFVLTLPSALVHADLPAGTP